MRHLEKLDVNAFTFDNTSLLPLMQWHEVELTIGNGKYCFYSQKIMTVGLSKLL